MALNANQQTVKKVNVANVVRHKGDISVPENMTLQDAAAMLLKKAKDEETETDYSFSFHKTLPQDGGWALKQVLDKAFSGFASSAEGKEGFFGKQNPRAIMYPSGPNGETVEVPWGNYTLPHGITMCTSANFSHQSHMWEFSVVGTCKRMHLPLVNDLMDKLREFLRENSLYRGKAVRVEFTDEDGDTLDEAKVDFIDLSRFDESQAIFSHDVDEEIKALVYSPLSSPRPRKIGVLLTGQPGVGKTLVMSIAAHKAQLAGRTVVYCKSRDFTTALRFAMNYEGKNGAVVDCEDIDRILTGQRTSTIDAIYNAMDGPDTKYSNVSVLLTTNDLSVIPDPFIRPGRVRQTLELAPPDTEAVVNLLKYYGAHRLEATITDTDLRTIAGRLSGRIPATIADVVARALDIAEYKGRTLASLADLEVAERSMNKQLRLLDSRNHVPVEDPEMVKAAKVLATALYTATNTVPKKVPLTTGNGHSAAHLPLTTPIEG